MKITQAQMLALLESLEPYNHKATVWRKLSNGKIVRFVDWAWKSK